MQSCQAAKKGLPTSALTHLFIPHCPCRKTRGSNLLINWEKYLGHTRKILTLGAAKILEEAQGMGGTQNHTLKSKRSWWGFQACSYWENWARNGLYEARVLTLKTIGDSEFRGVGKAKEQIRDCTATLNAKCQRKDRDVSNSAGTGARHWHLSLRTE